MQNSLIPSNRPRSLDKVYRLYIDESGDHVFKRLEESSHRYLCLLGCWFQGYDYRIFQRKMEDFKQRHLPHNPDDPLILHREDMVNRRGPFRVLLHPDRNHELIKGLLDLVKAARFKIVAVIIDKKKLIEQYSSPEHPYNLGMKFMLQRYCGYLNHINRCGDVLAESRGGREDKLLKAEYESIYKGGERINDNRFYQEALTSCQLKVKPKKANIAGLQLADILGHPIKQDILIDKGKIDTPLGSFAQELIHCVEDKFNRHLYDGRVDGYGKGLFPK